MKLLVADPIESFALEELKHLEAEVSYEPNLSADQLPDRLHGVGILIVRSTPITAKAIEAARQLNLIIQAEAGVTGIDVAAASAQGIYVAHCPGKHAIAVAELVMGFIGALDRQIPDATMQLHTGQWNRSNFVHADGLFGKTIGLVGFGAIAREVATRARAFGMNILAYGRSLTPQKTAEYNIQPVRSLEELANRSHIFSIHLPLTDRTRGIINKNVLEALPQHAILINTSQAEIIDEEALLEIAIRKQFRIGLDVFKEGTADNSNSFFSPFLSNKNLLIYGTPHIGACTKQAQHAVAAEVVRITRSFLVSGTVPNCVNVCATTPARYQMVIRSLDKIGVLANVLGVVKRHGLNIEELSSTIFEGALAACTKIRLTGRPNESCIGEIRAFSEVLHVDVVALPNLA